MIKSILLILILIGVLSLYFSQEAAASTGTKIYLDPPPKTLYVGQTVTFSGTLVTSSGSPLQGATIYIMDEDTFGPDDVITRGPTNAYGEFRISVTVKDWDEFSGASDIYAVFEGAGGYERSKSRIYESNVYEKKSQNSNPSYSKPKSNTQANYGYYPTKLTLDPIPSYAYPGQKIIFSGKLTTNGQPLQNAQIEIKDEDFVDFDDTLAIATTDSKGRFSKSWTVKDVDSSDRKLASFLLRFVDPTFSVAPTINGLFNAMEADTIEIYAEFSGSTSYQKSNTCSLRISSGSSYTSCTNRIIVIEGSGNTIQDRVVSAALGEIIPGGVVTQNSDVLYSIMQSGEISEKDLKRILGKAIASELGISSSDHSIEEMISMLAEN